MSSPNTSASGEDDCSLGHDGGEMLNAGGSISIASHEPTLMFEGHKEKDADVEVRAIPAAATVPNNGSGSCADRSCGNDTAESSDDESSTSSTSSSSSSTSSASSRSMSTLVSEASDSSSSGSVLSSDESDATNDNDDEDGHSALASDDGDGDLSEFEDRLRRKFAARDKILKSIARENKGKRAYVEFLRQNEEDVRAEAMRILEEKKQLRQQRRNRRNRKRRENESKADAGMGEQQDIDKGEGYLVKDSKSSSGQPSTRTKSMVRLIRFEKFHTASGFVTLILYCVAHMSVYECLNNIFLECTRNTDQNLAMATAFVFALVLSRLSGGIFCWVGEATYASIKFDVHNRLRLFDFDVLVLRWFRRHPVVKYTSDVVSLYLCFISISHFVHYWIVVPFLDVRDDVLSNLPSTQFDFCRTRLQEILGDGLSSSCSSIDLSGFKDERACFDDTNSVIENGPYCYDAVELGEALTEEDWEYFVPEVSVSSMYSFVGDSQAALTRPGSIILFYTASAVFSIATLAKLCKFRFWEL